MTVGEFLQLNTARLKAADIVSARLDCLVLLEDALARDRAHLLAHPATEIPASTEAELNNKIAQRVLHIPLAYLRGKASFYGREFIVNKHVLVPRPETEAMITLLKSLSLPPNPRTADMGTGSGCLGITVALEIKNAVVDLCDTSPSALAVATQNAQMHNVKVAAYQTDLFQKYPMSPNVVLANLPYVPTNYPINQAAKAEPPLALFAGPDGLSLYRRFWKQLKALPSPPQFALIESLPKQHQKLAELARASGYHHLQTDGLVQCFEASL